MAGSRADAGPGGSNGQGASSGEGGSAGPGASGTQGNGGSFVGTSGEGGSDVGSGGRGGGAGGDGGGTTGGSSGVGASSGAGAAGGVDGGDGGAACVGPDVSVRQLITDMLPEQMEVQLPRALALSQKFLVARTEKSCLWGAIVSDVAVTSARSDGGSEPTPGVLAVAFAEAGGEPGDAASACRQTARGIPDDLAPGDVLALAGKISRYAPKACDAVTPETQLVLDPDCATRRLGKAPLPKPTLLSRATADALALGESAALLRFAGARVRLEAVSVVRDPEQGDGVGAYGVVTLAETQLGIHNKIYYNDLTLAGPGDPNKRPEYPYPTKFEFVEGLIHLDYCSWSLNPIERCGSTEPASGGCP